MLPTKTKKGKRKAAKQESESDAIDHDGLLLPNADDQKDVSMEDRLTPVPKSDHDVDNDEALLRFDFDADETFEEGDLIWVKYGRDPHWPAVVLKVIKRRNRMRRVRIRFIEFDENDKLKHRPLSLTYNSTRMQPISKDYDARKNSQMTDDVSKRFKKVIERVERFLFSCSQPSLRAIDYFGATEECPTNTEGGEDDGGEEGPCVDAIQTSLKADGGTGGTNGIRSELEPEEDECRTEMAVFSDDDVPFTDKRTSFSEDTYRRITERQKAEKVLVNLIKTSEKVKLHLRDVLLEETKSVFHSRFHNPGKTRAEDRSIKMLGFGPIENELNVAELTKFLQRHLCTMKSRRKQDNDIYYITDVWFPEATIYGIHLQRNVSLEEAEQIFARGVDYTPEEMAVFTDDMVANTTDEDRAEQRARTKRYLANNGLDVV